MGLTGHVTGVVLAGGASQRMGTDKRSILIDGAPMLVRAARAVSSVSDELIISCRRHDLPDPSVVALLGARLVFDCYEGSGPLAGLEASLGEACGDPVIVAAGDMPWISIPLLQHLIELAVTSSGVDAVVVQAENGPQPLLAAYRRRSRFAARRLLETGERRMMALLASLDVRLVPSAEWRLFDPTGLTVANLNEGQDLPASPKFQPVASVPEHDQP